MSHTPKYTKKKRKGEHPDKQPLVREYFDLISDKISFSIPRLVSNQGEMTSPQGDYGESENIKKNFYSIISKLEKRWPSTSGGRYHNTTYTIRELLSNQY